MKKWPWIDVLEDIPWKGQVCIYITEEVYYFKCDLTKPHQTMLYSSFRHLKVKFPKMGLSPLNGFYGKCRFILFALTVYVAASFFPITVTYTGAKFNFRIGSHVGFISFKL